MSRTNIKYGEILKAAREVFWKHGFKRVTIEEICKQAGVSKMTFYKFFPNKLELARAVFDKEAARGAEDFRKILNSRMPPGEKMNRILLLKLQGTNDISREFLSDFYNNPELGLKEHIEKTTEKIWKEIVNDFRMAQEIGTFRKEIKPELIFYMSQKMMEMINDENLVKLYQSPQDMIIELASFFIYGMLPRKNV